MIAIGSMPGRFKIASSQVYFQLAFVSSPFAPTVTAWGALFGALLVCVPAAAKWGFCTMGDLSSTSLISLSLIG